MHSYIWISQSASCVCKAGNYFFFLSSPKRKASAPVILQNVSEVTPLVAELQNLSPKCIWLQICSPLSHTTYISFLSLCNQISQTEELKEYTHPLVSMGQDPGHSLAGVPSVRVSLSCMQDIDQGVLIHKVD